MTKIQFTPEAIALSDAINVWKQEVENLRRQIKILDSSIGNAKAYLHGLTIFGTQEQRDNIGKAIEILEGKV